jgi:hypothetical protein
MKIALITPDGFKTFEFGDVAWSKSDNQIKFFDYYDNKAVASYYIREGKARSILNDIRFAIFGKLPILEIVISTDDFVEKP